MRTRKSHQDRHLHAPFKGVFHARNQAWHNGSTQWACADQEKSTKTLKSANRPTERGGGANLADEAWQML